MKTNPLPMNRGPSGHCDDWITLQLATILPLPRERAGLPAVASAEEGVRGNRRHPCWIIAPLFRFLGSKREFLFRGNLSRMLAVLAAATVTLSVARAQVPATATSTPAPSLAGNVSQILKLFQANVGDDLLIAFIKNSGAGYGLTADQIIYLRQQGVSDPVLMAMLNQPRPAAGVTRLAAPAPAVPPEYYAAQPPPAPAAPPVTYVQTVPDTADYSPPYYSPDYYHPPYYDYYPSYGWSEPLIVYWSGGGGRAWGRTWNRGAVGFGGARGGRGGPIGFGRTGVAGPRGTTAPRRR